MGRPVRNIDYKTFQSARLGWPGHQKMADKAPNIGKILGVELAQTRGDVVRDSYVVRVESEVLEGNMDREIIDKEPEKESMGHGGKDDRTFPTGPRVITTRY